MAALSPAYVAAALERACNAVQSAQKGNCNNTLNTEAYGIGQLIGANVLEYNVAHDALLSAALANGMMRPEALDTIASGLKGGMRKPRDGSAPAEPQQQRKRSTADLATQLYKDSVPARGTIVERYLRDVRGLAGPVPDTLRYHPSVKHTGEECKLPAMIAPVRDVASLSDRVEAVHVTWLDPETARKRGDPPKKMYGSMKGGAIWLSGFAAHMLIAEGIEKALACQTATDMPAVVGLSATILQHIHWPRGTKKVTFCADPNGAGEKAILRAAKLWAADNIDVAICYPPIAGKDWDECPEDEVFRAIIEAKPWRAPNDEADDEGSITGHLDAPPPDALQPSLQVQRLMQHPMPVTFDGDPLPTRPRELIKQILPYAPGTIAFIGGQSGAGKTFVAIHLALCLTTGMAFFDHPVRETCGVIYLAAEGYETIYERLTVAKLAASIDASQPIAIVSCEANLADEATLKHVIVELQALSKKMIANGICDRVGVLIIDTVAAAFAIQDENSNAEIPRIIMHMRTLGRALDVVVVPLHHYGKNEASGLRGASAWRGGADAVLAVIADRDELTNEVSARRISNGKNRLGEEGPISGFQLEFHELGTDFYGDAYGSCAVVACDDEGRKKPQKDRAKTWADQVFRNAFNDALLTSGMQRNVANNGPLVLAVRLKQVRAEFVRKFATGEEGTANKSSQRSAWRRALERAHLSHQYGSETDGKGEGWIWEL